MSKTFIGRAVACLGTILFSVSAHADVELAFDKAGNLFEKGRDSIVKFAPDGTRTTIATEGSFSGMAIDGEGNVFTAEGETIVKFAPDGKRRDFASGFEYGNPFELVFDDKGNLFVAVGDSGSESIVKFTPDGAKSIVAPDLSPTAMVFDSAGNLFVASYRDHSIFKLSPDGNKRTFATGIGHVTSMIFDHKGNLFVADWEKDSIFKITPDGVKSAFASKITAEAMAFDKPGNLFVALPHSILKFAPDGKKTTFAKDIPGFAAFVFEKADNLLVADSATDSIFKFTSDGTKTTFAAAPSPTYSAEDAKFPSPDGKFAFLTNYEGVRTIDLIDKKSGKKLERIAEEDSYYAYWNVLWAPDSKRFALMTRLGHPLQAVDVYFRNGEIFQKIDLPELPTADIPEKLKRGKSFPHVAASNWQTAKEWKKDGSLVVTTDTTIDGAGPSLSATRTVVLGFAPSGKAKIVKSTIKYETGD
jgi:sugar lactone lactonase YvrE